MAANVANLREDQPEPDAPEPAAEVPNDASKRLVVGSFQMNLKMPNEASISCNGMIYLDDKQEEVDARMDTFLAALRRQQEIAEIPTLEASLEQVDAQIKGISDVLDAATKKKNSGKKLTSQDHQQIDNLPNSLKQMREHRTKGENRINAIKEKYGLA